MTPEFLTSEKDQLYEFKVNSHVFVFFQSSFNEKMCCFHYPQNTFNKDSIRETIQKVINFLNVESNNISFKIIGPKLSCVKLHSILSSQFNLTADKVVYRESEFEIQFNLYIKKVKINKDKSEDTIYQTSTSSNNSKVRLLVVDDSAVIRKILYNMFEDEESIEIVASTGNPLEVEQIIKDKKPSAMTLDIHMPEMNGVELLKSLPESLKIPTILLTSLNIEEGPLVLEGLEHGAFDYLKKPSLEEIGTVKKLLIDRIQNFNQVNISDLKKNLLSNSINSRKLNNIDDYLICIGSSTGGTNALKNILLDLPAEIPPILITQHIPAVFSKAFADRLNDLCPFTVKEAEHNEFIKNSTVYIAPGAHQMKVKRLGDQNRILITDDPEVNNFKPSVDYLFNSIADQIENKKIIACILTGMGNDGAKGLLALHQKSYFTIAQNKETSVVFGMPQEAIKLNAADEVLALNDIAPRIIDYIQNSKKYKKAI